MDATPTEDSRSRGHRAVPDADLASAPFADPATASRSIDAEPAEPHCAPSPSQRLAEQPSRQDAQIDQDAVLPGLRIGRFDPATGDSAIVPERPIEECLACVQASGPLDDCVAEFTRRLRACLALPDDDEHFHARVLADIQALKVRCRPEDAFRFELKAARVLAEFGFTAWPLTAAPAAAHAALHDVAPVVDAPASDGEPDPRPDPHTGARAA